MEKVFSLACSGMGSLGCGKRTSICGHGLRLGKCVREANAVINGYPNAPRFIGVIGIFIEVLLHPNKNS